MATWWRRPRLKLIGEVTGLGISRKSVYFELRDSQGAVPCAMWRTDWDRLDLPDGAVSDGTEVIVTGGPDFYAGSATASPRFSFRCTDLRPAGEGDLLAQLAELRRRLEGEGLFELQRRLPRPGLPRTIGIVTGRGSAAEADLLAGLERRGWRGAAVFAHPPVQDRHAAPQISRAVADLAGIAAVEVILIARGGGSLADLWAFCDENLCRTVALLRVPVISAVGHESDLMLLDRRAGLPARPRPTRPRRPCESTSATPARDPRDQRQALPATAPVLFDRQAAWPSAASAQRLATTEASAAGCTR